MKKLLLISLLVALTASFAQADLNSLVREYRGATGMSERAVVLRKFGDEKPKGGVTFLAREFQSLESDDEEGNFLQSIIVEALGKIGSAKAGVALVQIAYAADEGLRSIIKGKFIAMEKQLPAIGKVAFALKDKSSAVGKVLLISAMQRVKSARRIAPLLEKALKDKNSEVRIAAAEALEMLQVPRGIAAIAKLLSDPDPEVAMLAADILAASNNPEKYRREILAALKSSGDKIKLRCLDLLSGMTDKKVAREVLPLAKSENAEIRHYVAAIIAASDDFSFVDRLLSMLESATGKEKLAVAGVLAAVSGVDHGADLAKWKEWWEKAKEEFRYAPIEISSTYSGAGTLTFFGTGIDSNKIIFIIDTSQSMNEMYEKSTPKNTKTRTTADLDKLSGKAMKIEVAKKELSRCIKTLTKDIKFNVFSFSTAISPWKTKLYPATRKNKADAIDFAKDMEPRGLTNLYGVIEAALSDKEVDTLYILTDGEPTTGRFGRTAAADAFVAAVLELIKNRKKKVRIHAFGFYLRGRGRAILVSLAEATGGSFKDL